jgi:hypothetical protein
MNSTASLPESSEYARQVAGLQVRRLATGETTCDESGLAEER